MDEMTLLASMRDEVPLAPPSSAAQRLFSAGLAEDKSSERAGAMRPRARSLPTLPGVPGQLRWRLAVTGVAAAGLAAALVAVNLPQHPGPSGGQATSTPAGQAAVDPAVGTVVPAKLLADVAGQGVLAHQQTVKPDQWIYQKIDSYSAVTSRGAKHNQVQTQWTLADGAETEYFAGGHLINGLVPGPSSDQILAKAAQKYEALSSLPSDPAALYAYFAKQVPHILANNKPLRFPSVIKQIKYQLKTAKDEAQKKSLEKQLKYEESLPAPKPSDYRPPTPQEIASSVFGDIESLLSGGVLPPSVTAELYHTLALVPGIVAKKDIKLVTGQSGVGFLWPQVPNSHINLEIILNPTTYQYLGQATWTTGANDLAEDVLLAQAPVAAPGDLP